METHSNKILVAAVLAVALAALIAFSLWLTAIQRSTGREYVVLVDRSVSGLLVGSPVTTAGVPVGRVMDIDLDPADPNRIRVRIDISKPELVIPEGTVAKMSGDLLFGTALLSLERPKEGGPPLVARAGEEAPVIRLETSGLAGLASDPTPMIESIAFATDRLLEATTPEQQRLIAARLEGMVAKTQDMAARGPELDARIAAARTALRENAASAAAGAARARETGRNLDAAGRTKARETRAQMAEARAAMKGFDEKAAAVRPTVQAGSRSIEELRLKIRNARLAVQAATEKAKSVESGGLGAAPTPTYKPEKR